MTGTNFSALSSSHSNCQKEKKESNVTSSITLVRESFGQRDGRQLCDSSKVLTQIIFKKNNPRVSITFKSLKSTAWQTWSVPNLNIASQWIALGESCVAHYVHCGLGMSRAFKSSRQENWFLLFCFFFSRKNDVIECTISIYHRLSYVKQFSFMILNRVEDEGRFIFFFKECHKKIWKKLSCWQWSHLMRAGLSLCTNERRKLT